MISIIEGIYFFYAFITMYMLCLFSILYLKNKDELYSYPKGKIEPVSIVMPCFNEGEHIGNAIESLLNLDYPKDKFEIIVVDDKSSDNSVSVIRKYVSKYKNVRLIVNKNNSGGAAEPTNIGIKAAKYGFIAVADSDSTPDRDALKKMIGFLQEDESVGGVTCSIRAKNRNTFFEKLQGVEYSVISFSRKLLDKVDAVYVTPGPFALYRKKILLDVGLFDKNNMTQDIEIVWKMLSQGYKARMCLATGTNTVTPTRFKPWWKQRIRWNIGGLQTTMKYKNFFFRKGMLGAFILPFFALSFVLGLIGLGIFVYLFFRRFFLTYLSTKFSLYAGDSVANLIDFNLSLSVLNYLGIVLFILGGAFTLFGLSVVKDKEFKRKNWGAFLIYFLFYLSLYPLILITSVYKFSRGKYSWR